MLKLHKIISIRPRCWGRTLPLPNDWHLHVTDCEFRESTAGKVILPEQSVNFISIKCLGSRFQDLMLTVNFCCNLDHVHKVVIHSSFINSNLATLWTFWCPPGAGARLAFLQMHGGMNKCWWWGWERHVKDQNRSIRGKSFKAWCSKQVRLWNCSLLLSLTQIPAPLPSLRYPLSVFILFMTLEFDQNPSVSLLVETRWVTTGDGDYISWASVCRGPGPQGIVPCSCRISPWPWRKTRKCWVLPGRGGWTQKATRYVRDRLEIIKQYQTYSTLTESSFCDLFCLCKPCSATTLSNHAKQKSLFIIHVLLIYNLFLDLLYLEEHDLEISHLSTVYLLFNLVYFGWFELDLHQLFTLNLVSTLEQGCQRLFWSEDLKKSCCRSQSVQTDLKQATLLPTQPNAIEICDQTAALQREFVGHLVTNQREHRCAMFACWSCSCLLIFNMFSQFSRWHSWLKMAYFASNCVSSVPGCWGSCTGLIFLPMSNQPLGHSTTSRDAMSQPLEPWKKPLLLSIESWLVNRDPYNGLLYVIIIPI